MQLPERLTNKQNYPSPDEKVVHDKSGRSNETFFVTLAPLLTVGVRRAKDCHLRVAVTCELTRN